MRIYLISAYPGDHVPGHELADPDCPEVPGLLERPEVSSFLAEHGYGIDDTDDPDGLMYLVTEDEEDEIPDGFPFLRLTS